MYNRLFLLPVLLFFLCCSVQAEQKVVNKSVVNILLITVDDMNWDSVGTFGNTIKDITPNIDQLASEGMKYPKAYVAASNCAPSRVAIQTGLYPQQSGARGFYYIDDNHTPSIATELRKNGFYTGVINKSTDTNPAPLNDKYWDYRSGFNKVDKYSAKGYGDKSATFFNQVKARNQPFYLVVNIADPHKPNFNDPKATKKGADIHSPSRIIAIDEVTVPEFLPDIPAVRKDIRNYFNSVKRADDTVGEVLKSLEQSGLEQDTLVIFLSDHGMPFPFAKSSVYDNGLRTPMVMKWPEKIQAGSISKDIVSVIDLMPTLLDVADLELPKQQSYLGKALLNKENKDVLAERKYAFGSFDENAHGYPVPMRGVISNDWNYVFNAWSDGEHQIKSAAMNHLTFRSMEKKAKKDSNINARVEYYKYRATEELCNLKHDPHCLVNLADNPQHASVKKQMQMAMRQQMVKTGDYLLAAFDVRDDKKALQTFMNAQHQQAKERAASYKWKRGSNIAGSTSKNTFLYVHQ